MRESELKRWFKGEVKKRIRYVKMYEPKTFNRGAPDLIILGIGAWATCEFKKDEDADYQPNQDYTTELLNEMGFARFVEPDNAEEVLYELERLFGVK